MVVVTFGFSNPWTLGLKVEVQTVKPGVAEIAIAEATRVTRVMREEWREEEKHCEDVRGGNYNEPVGLKDPGSGQSGDCLCWRTAAKLVLSKTRGKTHLGLGRQFWGSSPTWGAGSSPCDTFSVMGKNNGDALERRWWLGDWGPWRRVCKWRGGSTVTGDGGVGAGEPWW